MKPNFLMNPTKTFSMLAMAAVIGLAACEEETPEPQQENEVVPTTYTFENVDYSGQTARIKMLDSLVAKARVANDGTTKVTFEELNSIFTNASGNLFGTDKQIKDKTEPTAVEELEGYFQDIETYSGLEEGEESNPNIVGERLVTDSGIEPVQMIAKGLMGSLLYYQATSVYLSDDKMNVDNTEVTEGKGTAMQHHWDEAFGYFGAPEDYLTNEEAKSYYWANYAKQRDEVIDVKEDIFNAFIEGRAAISRGDLEARDEAIEIIKEKWELLAAANTVHYINSAIEDLGNNNEGDFYHHLSEGKAFLNTLKYNLDKSISIDEINAINELLGDNPKESFADKDATIAALEQANLKLQQAFGFTDPEMINL